MTRAAKRQAHRARQKAQKKGEPQVQPQHIDLVNPESDNFGHYIFGNATRCERVAKGGSGQGKTLVIAGAGPSLRDNTEWCEKADEVWGCNSAAIWLYDNGHKVTHGFTVDQQAMMCEEWYSAPPIEYLVASSCHPHLVDYLIDRGRKLTFFHNYVGLRGPPVQLCDCGHNAAAHQPHCVQETEGGPCKCQKYDEILMSYESWMYSCFYESTAATGAGLNAVTRAVDLAAFMGFDDITVIGADCAIQVNKPKPDVPFGAPEHMKWLREDTVMHADGGSALASGATPVTLGAMIDGRHWETKPDLIISAVWLVRMERVIKQLHLVGDTLPVFLRDKDDSYLDQLPSMVGPDGGIQKFDVATESYNFLDKD